MPASLDALFDLPTEDLLAKARSLGVVPRRAPWRDALVAAIFAHETGEQVGCGVLEVHGEGFGFLRSPDDDLLPGKDDIYVGQTQIKRFELRTGDTVIGRVRAPKEGERYPALLRVDAVNGDPPDERIEPFEQLTAVHPTTRLPLAHDEILAAIDASAPLGLGARGVLLAPNRAERLEVLRRMAALFATDDRFVVTVLLVGERPEEVTEWRETIPAEIVATPIDEAPSKHLHVADVVFERARRLAERGEAVVLIVDSLTRLLDHAATEGAGDGSVPDGLPASAIPRLRRWLASGRDTREAGSVTLIAALDRDDGATSPRVLREVLDAATWVCALSDQRGLPAAVDPLASWSRDEPRLLTPEERERRTRLRARIAAAPELAAELQAEVFRPTALDTDAATGK